MIGLAFAPLVGIRGVCDVPTLCVVTLRKIIVPLRANTPLEVNKLIPKYTCKHYRYSQVQTHQADIDSILRMASAIPILQDLLPMILPSSVHVTKSSELDAGTGQTEGMIRKGAIIDKSDKICASGIWPDPTPPAPPTSPYSSPGCEIVLYNNILTTILVMIAKPHSASAVHHHGEQDTIVYASSGHGTIVTKDSNGEFVRHDLSPGDFALIHACKCLVQVKKN